MISLSKTHIVIIFRSFYLKSIQLNSAFDLPRKDNLSITRPFYIDQFRIMSTSEETQQLLRQLAQQIEVYSQQLAANMRHIEEIAEQAPECSTLP